MNASNIFKGRIAIVIQNALYLWSFKQQNLIATYTPPRAIPSYSLMLLRNNEIVVSSFDSRLQLLKYNFKNSTLLIYLFKGRKIQKE